MATSRFQPACIGETEPSAIREELERILATRHFRSSKQCSNLLRHVVEQTLAGDLTPLREKTLGVDVFGREPSYDTTADPVVRTSASEIRKRLAQYYQQSDCEASVRIELPSGSYVADFQPIAAPVPAVPEISIVAATSIHTAVPAIPPNTAIRRRFAIPVIGALVIGAALTAYLLRPRTALAVFWSPVLGSGDTVSLLVGGNSGGTQSGQPGVPADAATGPSLGQSSVSNRISFADAQTLARLAGLVESSGEKFRMLRQDAATLDSLRDGPVILIGGFNNPWVQRLGMPLRFTLGQGPNRLLWIQDARNPGRHDWQVVTEQPARNSAVDYALISKFVDPRTGKFVVVCAGLLSFGTQAAGEFLTHAEYFDPVAANAPAHWERMNMQAVISTEVIEGHIGRPKVEATHFWQ